MFENMFKSKEPKQEKPKEIQKEEPKVFSRSEAISKTYKQLTDCCTVLSEVNKPEDSHAFMSMHTGGWRIWEHTITNAGIDIEEVYAFIESLAQDRKLELERELAKIEEL